MCSSVCIPSDVDGIGMTRPVSCCYSDLCNFDDGAASLRISFVPVGMLASSLCVLFWTRLWGAVGGVFHAEETNKEENKPLSAQLSVWVPHGEPSKTPRNCFFSTFPFPTTKREENSGGPNKNFWIDSTTPAKLTMEFLCCAGLVGFEPENSAVWNIFKARNLVLRAFCTSLEHFPPQC